MSGAVYRSADIRMWGDENVLDLSVAAERIWTWLLIGPHTTAVPGLIVTTRAGMAERMRMSLRTFDRALAEIVDKKMADVDWKAGVIVLPNAPAQDINRCQSTSTAVAWAKVFSQHAPQCELTRRHRVAIASALADVDAAMVQAFELQSRGHYKRRNANDSTTRSNSPNDSPNGSANASPEQDPGTRTGSEEEKDSSAAAAPPRTAQLALVHSASANKPPERRQRARRQSDNPLPFSPDQALALLAEGGRFVASKLERGHAIAVTGKIRAYPNPDTWRTVGQWLGAGGDGWKSQAPDVRSIGQFDAWVSHANAWAASGRPAFSGRIVARGSPPRTVREPIGAQPETRDLTEELMRV